MKNGILFVMLTIALAIGLGSCELFDTPKTQNTLSVSEFPIFLSNTIGQRSIVISDSSTAEEGEFIYSLFGPVLLGWTSGSYRIDTEHDTFIYGVLSKTTIETNGTSVIYTTTLGDDTGRIVITMNEDGTFSFLQVLMLEITDQGSVHFIHSEMSGQRNSTSLDASGTIILYHGTDTEGHELEKYIYDYRSRDNGDWFGIFLTGYHTNDYENVTDLPPPAYSNEDTIMTAANSMDDDITYGVDQFIGLDLENNWVNTSEPADATLIWSAKD